MSGHHLGLVSKHANGLIYRPRHLPSQLCKAFPALKKESFPRLSPAITLLHCLPKFCYPYLHWYFDTLWELLSSRVFCCCFTSEWQNFGRQWMNFYTSALNSSFITILCFANVISNIHIMNLWNSKKYFVRQGMSALKSRMHLDKWFELIVISISFATSDKCTSTFMSSTKMGVLTFCQAVKGNMTNV